jgi:hypothetical protein
MSTTNVTLKQFTAHSFMGIHKEHPIVLDFTQTQDNITLIEGDQGLGKTSTLTALLYAVGAETGVELKHLVNQADGTIKLEHEFETADGKLYRVNATKSKFLLERYVKSEDVWIPESEPKTKIKDLIRAISSPMFLKTKKGRDQIKWFRENLAVDPTLEAEEEKLSHLLQEASAARTNANREYERIKSALSTEPLYIDREQNLKRFAEKVTIDDVKAKFDEVTRRKYQYDSGHHKVNNLKNIAQRTSEHIEQLRQQLAQAETELEKTNQDIATGEKWLQDHQGVVDEFNGVQETFTQINTTLLEQQRWEHIQQQEADMLAFETAVQELDARKDDLRTELKKLTEKYLPPIEGLEVRIADLDSKDEGVYYNGKALAQISESELWGLFLKICAHSGINFVVVDNVTSLGSDAIDTLNMLAQQGVKVFATAMNRKRQDLKISFTGKLD